MAHSRAKKLTPALTGKMADLYIKGHTIAEIAKACRLARKTVANSISLYIKALNDAQSIRHTQNGNMWNNKSTEVRLHNPALKDEKFQAMISNPDSPDLPEFEEAFCWHYNITNDQIHSAVAAGLDEGLFSTTKEGAKIPVEHYSDKARLRAIAVLMKPKIQTKLEELRSTSLFDTAAVNKEYLQRVILQQVANLGGSEADRKLGRDYVQMLGRTFGGFTEKIEIGMVDHKESLRKLAATERHDDLATLRAAKEAEKQEDSDGLDRSGSSEV